MLDINPTNLSSFCRTCLVELTKCVSSKHDVYKFNKLAQLLSVLTSQVVSKNDQLPTFICQNCYEKILVLNDFRSKTLRSLQILSSIISKGATTKNLSVQDKPNEDMHENDSVNINWLEFDYGGIIKLAYDSDNKNLNVSPVIISEDFHIDTRHCKIEYISESEEAAEIKADVTVNNIVIEKDNDELATIDEFDALAAEEHLTNETENESESSSDIPISKVKNKNNTNKNTSLPSKIKYQKKKLSKTSQKFKINFHCDLCPRRFISQYNLDAHLRTHKGLKAFQCNQCERGYNKLSRLRQHTRDTHAEDQAQVEIVCSFEGCGKVFRRTGTYKVHYRLKHSNTKTEWKTYICEDCGRTFKNITTLREHSLRHRPEHEYPYKCETCGKRYISHRTYKEHLLRHAGIKNFECHFCGMKKTTRHELRTHINYHTKEKQWPCKLCPSVFNSSANLGMHDRVVHKGVRRFACRFCNQSFGKPDTLKHHEMRHTGEKPHACHVCNKRFIQAVALRKHMQTHAKDSGNTEKETAKNLIQRSQHTPAQLESHVMDVVKNLNSY